MSKKSKPQQTPKPQPKPEKPASKFEAELIAEAIAAAVAKATPAAKEKRDIPKGTCDPESIVLYHQKGDGSYWLEELNEGTGEREFVKYKPSRLTDHFIALGMTKAIYRLGLREIDWPFYAADRQRRVDYCGGLAGHRAGMFTDAGGRTFLVTTEARGIWDKMPAKGSPEFILAFTKELLQWPGEWEHFCFWMAARLRSILRGEFRPGPALGLAGARECGKSLLQTLITETVGGREADPWKYMMGEEKHNFDMIEAEHWKVEDPPATTDIRARRFFGNMIKVCAFNDKFRIRAMAKDALTARLDKCISISVNDELENLAVFPPFDDSLRDKLSLLKCSKVIEALKQFDIPENQLAIELPGAGLPVAGGDQDRNAIRRKMREELPQWRAYLLKHFSTPLTPYDAATAGTVADMRNRRTGIHAYQNPELLERLTSMSPEVRLLSIFDQVWCAAPDTVKTNWTGRAVDLEKLLQESDFRFQADRLLSRFDNAAGTYLGRAMRHFPERISREVRHGGVPYWTIKPAKEKEQHEPTEQFGK